MVAPSGEQHEISGGGYRAVVTECGAGLRLLEHEGRTVVAGFAEDAMASAGRGQLLVPWPNRIEDGRYAFEGQDLQLPLSEPSRGHASHGLVRWVSWTLKERDEASVALGYRLMAQSGYPWTLELEVRYAVADDGLTVTVAATNLSDSAAPYAQGAHPYLSVGDDPVDNWELTVPGATEITVDERKIPRSRHDVAGTPTDFRSGRLIGDAQLDNAFTDLAREPDGRAVVRLHHPNSGRSTALWMDEAHHYAQVFTGDGLPGARTAVAVEPMTAPPNAFRTGESLIVLSPGELHTASWGVTATN